MVYTIIPPSSVLNKRQNMRLSEKDEEILNKHCCKAVNLPAKFEQHVPAFSKMLTECDSMCDKLFGRVSVPGN